MNANTREGNMDKRQAQDNLYNEGAEGYNPYPRRESAEPEWSVLAGKIDRLMATLASTAIADPRYAEIEAELATLRIAHAAALAADR